jgi:DNA polymerase I-like protein with 3'-5' exonuclease and polymerase domains
MEAKNLLEMHRRVFRNFWSWSDSAVNYAFLTGQIFTVFGWNLHIVNKTKERTIRNFPMQGNGAECLRLGCSLALEQGVKVCAPVHDALLIEAPESDIQEAVTITEAAMRKASEIVLYGFPLRTEAKIIRFPERYQHPRGKEMWGKVMDILAALGKNV